MKLKLLASLSILGLFTACETPEECENELGEKNACGAAGTAEDFKANVGDRVYFHFARHNLSADARRILDQQAAWLKTHSASKATVEGHCDIRGTADYNRALGERRAQSAKDALVSAGLDPMRIDTISYGKDRPVDQGHTEEAHARNRTAITVIGTGSSAS